VAAALAHEQPRLAVVRADGTTELWALDPDRVLEQLAALPAAVTAPVRGTFYPAVSFWASDKLLVRVARETGRSPDLIDVYDIDQREHQLIQSSHKGYDGSVTIWDMATRQQVASWRATPQHCLVAFMDGARLLLTAGEVVHAPRFELNFWRAPTFDEFAAGQARGRTKERRAKSIPQVPPGPPDQG
jgi:hypothetical protein